MFPEDQQEFLFPRDGESPEGWFDAQLSLPFPIPPAAIPSQFVIKRNGRREPFSKQKIAEAIAKAALAAGRPDPEFAESSAAAVAIYLAKHVNNESPSVEQISDAVERVLLLTAHPEVALAYVRHRDRRARIRRLRDGDYQFLLGEMEEARQEREARRIPDNVQFSIPAGQETLESGEMKGILESLTAEAGLDSDVAQEIADTIVKQIQNAGITHVSTPLVRELLCAQLSERGLWETNTRVNRLRIPLHETLSIITGTAPETLGFGPDTTDRVLAQTVKREYALSEVFSGPMARAHLAGDIHLHGLYHIDRLYRAEHTPSCPIIRSFLNFENGTDIDYATSLLEFAEFKDAYFSEPMGWYAFNTFLALYVRHLDESDLKGLCHHFLFSEQQWNLHGKRGTASLHLPWSVPQEFTHSEMGHGSDRNDYLALTCGAQQILLVLLDVLNDAVKQGLVNPLPFLNVEIDESIYDTLEGEHCLQYAASLALQRKEIRFILRRPRQGGEQQPALPPELPRNVVWHKATLNLARAALLSRKKADLYRILDEWLNLVFKAHLAKRDFIESLLGKGRVLSQLARQFHGCEYVNAERDKFAVGIDGLYECSEVVCGDSQGSLEERLQFMEDLLEWLKRRVARAGFQHNIQCCLEGNTDPKVSARFAGLDAQRFPNVIGLVANNHSDPTMLAYTTGVSLPERLHLSPLNIAMYEGRLHTRLDGIHYSRIPLTHTAFSKDSITDFIKKVLHNTHCAGLQLAP